jgi:hypothetical protein
MPKFFQPTSVFDPLFFFSDSSFFDFKDSSRILKTLLLFSISSIDGDYNKKLYKISADSLFG